MRETNWALDLDADNATAYAELVRDATWNGYGIADLKPPFRQHTCVALALRDTDAATCVIVRHPAFTSLIPSGDPAGLAAIGAVVELPERGVILAQDALTESITHWYAFMPLTACPS